MSELKRCKCGREPYIICGIISIHGFCVRCFCGEATPIYLEKEDAINDWNKRS